MSLVQDIITKVKKSKKIKNKNLYYGYIGDVKLLQGTDNHYTAYATDKVICQRLTDKQRDRYLRRKYPTFLDNDNCQIIRYLAIVKSNIQYYRIPSMNNKVVPYIYSDNIEDANLIENLDGVLVDVRKCVNGRYMYQSKLTLDQICEIEKQL